MIMMTMKVIMMKIMMITWKHFLVTSDSRGQSLRGFSPRCSSAADARLLLLFLVFIIILLCYCFFFNIYLIIIVYLLNLSFWSIVVTIEF